MSFTRVGALATLLLAHIPADAAIPSSPDIITNLVRNESGAKLVVTDGLTDLASSLHDLNDYLDNITQIQLTDFQLVQKVFVAVNRLKSQLLSEFKDLLKTKFNQSFRIFNAEVIHLNTLMHNLNASGQFYETQSFRELHLSSQEIHELDVAIGDKGWL